MKSLNVKAVKCLNTMLAWQKALEECYCEHTWLLPHLDVSSYYKMYLIYRHAVFFLGLLVGQKKAIASAQLWGPGVSWKHQKGRNRKQNNKSKPQQQQSRLSFYHYPCATSCPALTKTWFRKPLNTNASTTLSELILPTKKWWQY